MKRTVLLLCAGLAAGAGAAANGPNDLPRSSPEEQGVASAALLSFVEEADARIDAMNSVMLVRHGRVVAEGWWTPYSAETRHTLFSLTKSFSSTAVGLAVAEGRLRVQDPVLPFFPEDAPAEPSDFLKAMRLKDLLTMTTGHHAEAVLAPSLVSLPVGGREPVPPSAVPWTRTFLAQPVVHKPGTFFLYNTPSSYMLSAVVQKATGSTVLDYLRSRLFEPLGIDDPVWSASPQGLTIGGYGLSLRTEEIARFGQLYLQKGEWRGRRILPAAWVEEATSKQVSNGSNPDSDWEQGYGYQFWRCRHGCYRGDGAFGQYCVVMPEQDAVLVITSGVKDMQAVLNLVWEKLLPALQKAPLPPDAEGRSRLEARLARLTLRPQPRAATAGRAQRPVGAYVFPANDQKLESLALESAKGQDPVLVLRFAGAAEQRIACGHGRWSPGRLAYGVYPEQRVAASGGWTGDSHYTAKLAFYETPFLLTLDLRFSGDELLYDSEVNVAFGPTKGAQLVGRATSAARP